MALDSSTGLAVRYSNYPTSTATVHRDGVSARSRASQRKGVATGLSIRWLRVRAPSASFGLLGRLIVKTEKPVLARALKQAEIDDLRGSEALWITLSDAGDEFARHRGYAEGGIEALVKFLVELHHWRPADVRAFSAMDLALCMEGHSPDPDPDAHTGVDD